MIPRLLIILLLAPLVCGQNWQPTDYQKWQDTFSTNRNRSQFGGSIENYQKIDNSWAAIENDWQTVDDTLHTNRRAVLKTDVNNAGQATISFTHEGTTYTVSQRFLKVIWINTDTHNWTDIADVSWSTPSVDSNIIRWNNVIPGTDYAVRKWNGRVEHGVIFKPVFLDSAITLYDQREDSADIALGNVIAYQLTGVDNADSAIGNVDFRVLKNVGRWVFKLTRETVHFPGSDTLPPVYVKQRWIKQNNKIYCVEYISMRRIQQIHKVYPNAAIWHNTTTIVTGDPDFRDGMTWEDSQSENFGGATTLRTRIIGGVRQYIYFWADIPSPGAKTLVICSLRVRVAAYENDTTDIFYCTQPGAQNYVGNSGNPADSAEMNWLSYFEGGSLADSAWTIAGGDYRDGANDTLSTLITTGTGWRYHIIDSATVDSIVNGTLANNGYFMKVREAPTLTALHWLRSTEHAQAPSMIYVWEAGEEEEAPTRRRRLLIGGR